MLERGVLLACWLLLLHGMTVPAYAGSVNWFELRNAELELMPGHADRLVIEWRPAWLSEANAEELYLIDARGQLAAQVDIDASQSRGRETLELRPELGPYRLVLPGYSFRNIRVSHGEQTRSVMDPGKMHFFSSTLPGSTRLYFKIPAAAVASLAGKYHGGATGMVATRLSDGKRLTWTLGKHDEYVDFDSIGLPSSERDQIWQLDVKGSGKAAFWLEGAPNRFALEPASLDVNWKRGQVHTGIRLTRETLGPVPRLGVAMPYWVPDAYISGTLDDLGLQAASYYSFVDVIGEPRQRELNFRRAYAQQFGVGTTVTLMAGTGRRAVLQADREARTGLERWVDDTLALGDHGPHYLAFADEPNLNYSSRQEFEQYFAAMLKHLKTIPGVEGSPIRVVVPASSRWLNGPFRDGAARRTGLDWAAGLLARHDADIGGLAWHEWMVRSLYATRQYRAGIRAAAELVGMNEEGRPRKALLIDQTNISSGNSVSPFEQNTQYAALWWASVIINASADGLLDVLNWFHLADEPDHQKGLLHITDDDRIEVKPVGRLHALFASGWQGRSHRLHNPSFELDFLHVSEGRQHRVLGVNKSAQDHQLTITLPGACPGDMRLQLFMPTSEIRTGSGSCVDATASLELPGQSVFVLEWNENPEENVAEKR